MVKLSSSIFSSALLSFLKIKTNKNEKKNLGFVSQRYSSDSPQKPCPTCIISVLIQSTELIKVYVSCIY